MIMKQWNLILLLRFTECYNLPQLLDGIVTRKVVLNELPGL
jgi:hypothetical protein